MYKSGIYLTFTDAMGTEMIAELGFKKRNCHFGPNLRLW